MDTRKKSYEVGGSFLLQDAEREDVFIPEDFSEDQRLTRSTAERFVREEILPQAEQIRNKDFALVRRLMRQAAELGLVGADVPECWGGMQSDKVTSAIITEALGVNADFLVSFAAHCGIGTLPVVYFGTPEQKEKYLPRLASAEIIGAYALTEPGAGSDAQAITTRAHPTQDEAVRRLSGEKIWITNAGFADLITVFAKDQSGKMVAYLVSCPQQGLVVGPEEHKIGIKGSSTCGLKFDDVAVSQKDMLVGDGFKIAMNILNLGRFKLAAGCVGGAKHLTNMSAEYAKNRKAFGKSIGEFGLIRQKLAHMIRRTWLCEGVVYRAASLLDHSLAQTNSDDTAAVLKVIERHAVECAMVKVFGSEMLSFVANEAVQIHGGNGFMDENLAARTYCDARINEIFEGTNEINRLVVAGTLFKLAQRGVLQLFAAAKSHFDSLMDLTGSVAPGDEEFLVRERMVLGNLKKLTVMLYGAVAQQSVARGYNLLEEQEMLAVLADTTADLFAVETALARVEKLDAQDKNTDVELALTRRALQNACQVATTGSLTIAERIVAGDELRVYESAIRRLTKYRAGDCIALDRQIADRYLEGVWKFA